MRVEPLMMVEFLDTDETDTTDNHSAEYKEA